MLQHYDKFVAGINEVARVEEDLVAAYQTVKARSPILYASAWDPLCCRSQTCDTSTAHLLSTAVTT